MATPSCSRCACTKSTGVDAHAIAGALADGDLDRAIDLGLLQAQACTGCAPTCRDALDAARNDRLAALAARERFRARDQRLRTREQARDARRTAARSNALPPAAAAALARAKARAAKREPNDGDAS